jgi:hypothetical protein
MPKLEFEAEIESGPDGRSGARVRLPAEAAVEMIAADSRFS